MPRPVHELLEAGQAGQVEVVRRFVEEDDVVAAQHERGQRGPGRLTPRQGRHERAGVGHVGGGDPLGEVGGAEGQPALERLGVGVVGPGAPLGEGLGRLVERLLRGGDTGPALDELPHGLALPGPLLLR